MQIFELANVLAYFSTNLPDCWRQMMLLLQGFQPKLFEIWIQRIGETVKS